MGNIFTEMQSEMHFPFHINSLPRVGYFNEIFVGITEAGTLFHLLEISFKSFVKYSVIWFRHKFNGVYFVSNIPVFGVNVFDELAYSSIRLYCLYS